jgi:hypothetical protein
MGSAARAPVENIPAAAVAAVLCKNVLRSILITVVLLAVADDL